jgi:site-specific DNA-methyltransferase (adenine-specific)
MLADSGLFFVYGAPDQLPEIAVALESELTFKYWIAIKTTPIENTGYGHKGLLLFCREDRFQINKVRIPHPRCKQCGKTLRDWGGKAHLMHPEGSAISDVWSDRSVDPHDPLPTVVLNRVSAMAGLSKDRRGVIISGQPAKHQSVKSKTAGFSSDADRIQKFDKVYQGDCIEIMRGFKSESVDLAFADPPYNLAKNYQVFSDDQTDSDYIDWCNAWLTEYVRVLKPGGSLFVLNLPKWANHHFVFLNTIARFHRWIAWDALSEPRGKLMPAHYALLHFVRNGRPVRENSNLRAAAPEYCVRATCVNQRIADKVDDTEPLGDIWSDVFRLKHKSARDSHPCQLPEKLMERIIKLATNPGDVVLDAFCGAGTTAVTAARLGRRYITIDINPDYVAMTNRKLKSLAAGDAPNRTFISRPRPAYSKKDLQMELKRIAMKLGRLPGEKEIERFSSYPMAAYKTTFPTLGKALKAAKLVT